MTQSRQALQSARNLEEELLFTAPPEADLTPDLRLIGFCMSKLGQRNLQLASKPGADVVQLLDYNDIHHRRVSAPRDLSTNHWDLDPDNDNEFPLMIVFDGESQEPLALYRQGGKNWLYSGQRQQHFQAAADVSLAEDAQRVVAVHLPDFRALPPPRACDDLRRVGAIRRPEAGAPRSAQGLVHVLLVSLSGHGDARLLPL